MNSHSHTARILQGTWVFQYLTHQGNSTSPFSSTDSTVFSPVWWVGWTRPVVLNLWKLMKAMNCNPREVHICTERITHNFMGSWTPVKQPQSLLIKKALPVLTSPYTVYDSPTDINFMKWQNSSIRFSKSQPHPSSPAGLATVPPCRETPLAPQPQGPARLRLSR